VSSDSEKHGTVETLETVEMEPEIILYCTGSWGERQARKG